jgi:hypothetical protein
VLFAFAVVFWVLTFVGWFITQPGVESLNVLAAAIASSLSALLTSLKARTASDTPVLQFRPIPTQHKRNRRAMLELVIRRFDQHYQNFCGFESIETAQVYLGVFEKVYRLTPSDDAQPRIRGKCPLELAGYDLSQLPLAALWNGLSIEWPMEAPHGDVPNR